MKRREFFSVLGGAAAVWPLAARAQQSGQVRRVSMLIGGSESGLEYRAWVAAFVQGLAQLGWTDGRNLRLDVRWTDGSIERARAFAKELAELQPDVILAATTPVTVALKREIRTIPIVFTVVSDPVGAGFVASLARPDANITGFINEEAAMGGKWLEVLKEAAPRLTRAGIMFNPDTAPGGGTYFLGSFQSAARSMVIDSITIPVRSDAEIETAITSLGRQQAGLVIMSDSFVGVHSGTVRSAALRSNVPTISDAASFARAGGLLSYGSSNADSFRRSASYVDRILRGEMPGNLPVQVPVLFELVINLKTAKALGIDVPLSLQQRADDVIE
jgi:putative ABC transport system substrate-binding protein